MSPKISDKYKGVATAAIILLAISIILALVGAIMSFDDVEVYYYGNTSPRPQAGIMPVFGFIFLVVSLIIFCFCTKKPNKLPGITSVVLEFIGQLLLFLSIIAIYHEYGAWFFACSAASLVAVVIILQIVYIVCSSMNKQSGKSSTNSLASRYNRCADSLLELVSLYEMAIISESEMKSKRDKILSEYGFNEKAQIFDLLWNEQSSNGYGSIEGYYVTEDNSKSLNLRNGSFELKSEWNVIGLGEYAYDKTSNKITLIFEQNRTATFIYDGHTISNTTLKFIRAK